MALGVVVDKSTPLAIGADATPLRPDEEGGRTSNTSPTRALPRREPVWARNDAVPDAAPACAGTAEIGGGAEAAALDAAPPPPPGITRIGVEAGDEDCDAPQPMVGSNRDPCVVVVCFSSSLDSLWVW